MPGGGAIGEGVNNAPARVHFLAREMGFAALRARRKYRSFPAPRPAFLAAP